MTIEHTGSLSEWLRKTISKLKSHLAELGYSESTILRLDATWKELIVYCEAYQATEFTVDLERRFVWERYSADLGDSRRDKATAFVGEFVIPLLIGLQMHDLDMYHNFRIGKDPTPLVNILASIDAPECKFLLCGEETFVADKNMSPMPGGTHVIKKDRVIEVYNAIFSKTGEVDVGQMTFSDRTREYLYEMESILIPDGNFDFE